MYLVTQDFLDKVKADKRQIYSKIQIDYTDPFLDQSIQVQASEQANVSYPSQTADVIAEPYAKYAALDGAWVLGQDWALAPGPDEATIRQMGWWGSQLAQADGSFALPYPALTVLHALRPIYSLQVVGDSKRQEYPVDFTIQLYAADNTLLYTETVVGNTQVSWSKTLANPVLDVAKQILTITKWSHAGRQVKILEFFTSIQETYEGDDVLMINLLEEREVSHGSLPVGNISANEIDIKLNNESRKFDAGNTQSPLRNLVKANRRIRAWLGAEAENAATENPPTFTRSSIAYLSDGTQVAANAPRLEPSQMTYGKAILIEEGTTNLLTANQSSVETSLPAGYVADGVSATISRVTTQARYGIASIQVSCASGGGAYDGADLWNGAIDTGWPVTEGKTYTISLYAKGASGGEPFWFAVYSSDWTFLNDIKTLLTTTWQRFAITITIPAGKSGIFILARRNYTTNAVTFYVDGLQLEQKPYPTSFVDGTRASESLTIPTAGILNPQEGTIECWVKIEPDYATRQKRRHIFSHGPDSTANAFDLIYDGSIGTYGRFYFRNYYSGGNYQPAWTATNSLIGWNYIACTWKSGVGGKLYVNGQLVASALYSANWTLESTMTIGAQSRAAYWWNSLIDDFRISNRARSDAEILAAYASGRPTEVDEATTYLLSFNGSIYPVEQVWVPLGTFWSGDWSVPEDGIYAATSGRDRLELLRKSTYSTSQVQQNKTLYDLAVAVLQEAGLKSTEYWVDTELQQYIVPYSYFENQSHREALRKIAEACLGQVYADRNGIVRVEGHSYLASKTTADITITADDYFRKDNPQRDSEIANYIEVETQPLRPAAAAEEVYKSNETINVLAGQMKSLTVYYNKTPCIEAAASLQGATNTHVESATYYAWGVDVVLHNSGASAENVTLVINAKPLSIMNKEKAIAQDAASITENGKIKYTFPANPLVQTLSMAQTIADALLASYKDPRRDVKIDWRGNQALLLGDRVTVVDRNEQNDYFVVRQELEYSGALRAKMEGRKA